MSARTRTALPVALALAFFAAAPAGAQDVSLVPSRATVAATAPAAAPTTDATVATAPAGPTMQAASVAVRHQDDGATATVARKGSTPGLALMVVGGAALLGGLIIGDDAGKFIAIGGLVAGLFGLYEYLQ